MKLTGLLSQSTGGQRRRSRSTEVPDHSASNYRGCGGLSLPQSVRAMGFVAALTPINSLTGSDVRNGANSTIYIPLKVARQEDTLIALV